MSITVEEKEQLYKEFKDRMLMEQQIKGDGNGVANLAPSRDYFNQEKTRLIKEGRWTPDLYPGWELISKLTCKVCGVKYVRHLEPSQLDIANNFATEVVKLYFETYDKGFK